MILSFFFLLQDGQKAIQVAATRGNRGAIEILFPLTSPIQSVPEWTIDGIIEHMQSEMGKQQVSEPEFML